MSSETGHRVEVNGINVYYEKVGNGSTTLILLPGYCGTSTTDFFEQLGENGLNKSKYTMIAWHPPGYGKSIPPKRTYDNKVYENDADLAAAMMKKLGYTLYSVLGWSDGGKTALFLASKYPSVVEKTVAWGVVCYNIPQYSKNFFITKNFSYWDPASRDRYYAEYGKENFELMYRSLMDDMVKCNLLAKPMIPKDLLKKIHCPVFILHGGKDPFVAKECAQFVVNNTSDSQLHIFPKGSHNIHIEFRDEFQRLVTQFLDE